LKGEPPGINRSEERASNFIPVGLSVVSGWDSEVLGLSSYRPSGLSDPDVLVACPILDCLKSFVEESLAACDVVGHGVLEVRVGIRSNPISSLNNSSVARIVPRSPSIDVTNRSGDSEVS